MFFAISIRQAQRHFVPDRLKLNKDTNAPLHKSLFNRTNKFQPFQTRHSRKWELMVPSLGSMRSNRWEPASLWNGNPWFQDMGNMSKYPRPWNENPCLHGCASGSGLFSSTKSLTIWSCNSHATVVKTGYTSHQDLCCVIHECCHKLYALLLSSRTF